MKQIVITARLPIIAAATLGLAACMPEDSSAERNTGSNPEPATEMKNADTQLATFNDDGTLNQPVGWREWVFIGTPLTPHGLNGGKAAFPEFHNVYIDPESFRHYARTGEFRDGTQIAKELTMVRENNNEPDGSSFEVSGRGYFQGEFSGLELAVKDAARHPDDPGNWGYYSWGHKPYPYDKLASKFPAQACNACHESSAEDDFVFTQFYPVLRAAKNSESGS